MENSETPIAATDLNGIALHVAVACAQSGQPVTRIRLKALALEISVDLDDPALGELQAALFEARKAMVAEQRAHDRRQSLAA